MSASASPPKSPAKTYLLEHLVNISKRRAVEIPVAVHLEALSESTSGHLEYNVLYSLQFSDNLLVFLWQVAESSQNLPSFVVSSLQNEPTRTFRQSGDEDQDEDGKDDLESNREAPGNRARLEERESKVEPITQHDTENDK